MHYPTFRGKFNSLKARVWLFLANERELNPRQYYTSVELAELLMVNKASLQSALTKWTSLNWRRILKRRRGNQHLFEYRLSAKGYAWVEDYRIMIPIERYRNEDRQKILIRSRPPQSNTFV